MNLKIKKTMEYFVVRKWNGGNLGEVEIMPSILMPDDGCGLISKGFLLILKTKSRDQAYNLYHKLQDDDNKVLQMRTMPT